MTTETRTSIVWDYAPAPESADHIRLKDRYGLFLDGDFRDPADGRYVPTINPATEEPIAEVAYGGPDDVTAAVESARAAQPKWAALQGLERAKYLFRIARLIQERSRELAIVETMDGGKPLRESRDVDIPLAAAHFFHYAGWADKLRYGVNARESRAARRRRPDRALELPAADGGLEARAGAGLREHGDPQAGRDHAADRAAPGRDLPGGRAPAGRRLHPAGQWRHRCGPRALEKDQQDRLHRIDRGRPGHPGRARGHGHRR